jgi:hypothetical protein
MDRDVSIDLVPEDTVWCEVVLVHVFQSRSSVSGLLESAKLSQRSMLFLHKGILMNYYQFMYKNSISNVSKIRVTLYQLVL